MTRKVFVNPPKSWAGPVQMMFRHRGFEIVHSVEECDIIAFSGGEDVNPALYGEKPNPEAHVYFSPERDEMEIAGWKAATGKFKFGICRGGQLLNVLNGGKLWQDVDNHGRAHPMTDIQTGKTIWTSSVHHQQFRPGPEAVKVAVAREATVKIAEFTGWWRDEQPITVPDAEDIEVLWYPKDRALCIQGHPEYGSYGELTDYAFELIERYY